MAVIGVRPVLLKACSLVEPCSRAFPNFEKTRKAGTERRTGFMPFFYSFFYRDAQSIYLLNCHLELDGTKRVLGPSTVHTQVSLSPLTTLSWETTQPAQAK